MKTTLRLLSVVLLAASFLLAAYVPSPRPKSPITQIANINAKLLPGPANTWSLRPSSAAGGYIVKVTPREDPVEGNYVQSAYVRPEFKGETWMDVLRVQLPEGMQSLKANIRVYETSGLPVVMDFETLLDPGGWNGWIIAPTAIERTYIAEVTPLDPAMEGAYFEKMRIQSEWNGETWYDVLRLEAPAEYPALRVHVRVYELVETTPVMEIDTWLEPGDWPGFVVAPCADKVGYVIKVTQLDPPVPGGLTEKFVVQPEFNGEAWWDVLRLAAQPDGGAIHVNVRVYAVTDLKKLPRSIATWPKQP
jgi:hypothetical protein